MATKGSNRAIATLTHPLHSLMAQTWRMALDVYEGLGGFMDPERPYLIPHPREWLDHSIKIEPTADQPASMRPNPNPRNPSPKLLMRRKLARYENVCSTILNGVAGALFLQAASRTFSSGKDNEKVAAWWANCDARGTAVDKAMETAWTIAGVFGHAILLLDKGKLPHQEAAPAEGEAAPVATAADTPLPILCTYTPLDLMDWLEDEYGNVIAVKLSEAAPRESFDETISASQKRIRVVTDKDFTLYDGSGRVIQTGAHGFGRLPVVFLYAKRRTLTPVLGKAIIGDPMLFIDLYNLASEVRELLRNQTFGILNVPIGKDGNVEREQGLMGQQSGTSNVMFSSEAASYLSPDGANVTVYHEHIDRLARMIYRLAAFPWEGDSRVAESADSRRIKREELNKVLSGYAAELQRTDAVLLELVYRALHGDQWQAQMEKDGATVAYPGSFEPPDYDAIAAQCADAIALDLGPTATKELKKRFVRTRLPDLSTEQQQDVDDEIDAQTILTAEEKMQQQLDAVAGRMGAGGKKPPVKVEAAA